MIFQSSCDAVISEFVTFEAPQFTSQVSFEVTKSYGSFAALNFVDVMGKY